MRFDPEEIDQLAEAISKKIIERLRPLLPPKDSLIEGLLDVKGISKYLKVSTTQVYKLIKENRIPYKKVGRLPRFNKEEVDAYFKKEVVNEKNRGTL